MILLCIPYHPAKRYAMEHVFDWLEQQTYKDVTVLIRAHLGPYGEDNAIKQQFEYFRVHTLQEDYSHLYIMEADTIPPLDVLDKLMAHGKDIVGATYRYRSTDAPYVAWPKEAIEGKTGLVKVEGMGTGAVLLSRQALLSFTFFDWPQNDADYPMYDSLRAQGFDVWLDTDLLCKHYADKETCY